MARRGDELREHILRAAKDVFLEQGFERASMDEVASRAATSKRSLYAHFESKEKLFLAVIELVRSLFLGHLKWPSDYAEEPAEALVLYCGRYLEILLYEAMTQMSRVTMAEAARFPEGAAQHYDMVFVEVNRRLSAFLHTRFGLSQQTSAAAAQQLLGQVIYPRFPRALFGLEPLTKDIGDALSPDFDLHPIRTAVAAMLADYVPAPHR